MPPPPPRMNTGCGDKFACTCTLYIQICQLMLGLLNVYNFVLLIMRIYLHTQYSFTTWLHAAYFINNNILTHSAVHNQRLWVNCVDHRDCLRAACINFYDIGCAHTSSTHSN